MRAPAVGVVLTVTLAATAGEAHDADPDLEVTRRDDAERCPDAAQLKDLAAASRVRSPTASTHSYHVVFERSGEAYRAEIVDDTAHRTRRLEDKASTCTPLAQATAVVLATMWSSERDADESQSQPAQATVPPPQASATGAGAAPPSPPHVRPRLRFGAGSGIAVAIVRPVAPLFVSDATIEYGRGSFAIGVRWIPEQTIELAPGIVNVDLIAGAARGCAFAWDRTRLGGCAQFFAGGLHAAASGYSIDTQRTRPWFAVGLEIFVDGPLPLPRIRYRASIGAMLPVHAETFSVAGAGPAYVTPALGGLSTLSLEIGTQ
jgi:hypothetical protein